MSGLKSEVGKKRRNREVGREENMEGAKRDGNAAEDENAGELKKPTGEPP